jgi:hypothetical protein
VLPHGASSKKKPFSLRAILFKIRMAIHPRSSERGILVFSRNKIIWDTAQDDLPPLIPLLKSLLE